MLNTLMNISPRLFSHLLPRRCLLCGMMTAETTLICISCIKDLPILPHQCQQCAQQLPESKQQTSEICGACLSNPPPYDRTFALFPYQFPVIELIMQLKFQQKLAHANALAQLLCQRIRDKWYNNQPLPDLIIPIPLHRARLGERGFNQTLEIAKPIAHTFSIPLDKTSIVREKPTLPQRRLAAALRKKNMTKAFSTHRDYNGLAIAVLDDVMTTGHTLAACCQLLKQHGAKSIDVWCCARVDIALTAKSL